MTVSELKDVLNAADPDGEVTVVISEGVLQQWVEDGEAGIRVDITSTDYCGTVTGVTLNLSSA